MTSPKWAVEFTMPEGVCFPDVSIHKLDTLELAESFTMDEFPTIDSSAELNIEFVDKTDELNEAKSIQSWMDEWMRMIAESKEMREVEGTLYEFFEPDVTKDDATHMHYRIKKPIYKMTSDEKQRLKKLLSENFNIKEKDLREMGL